MTSCTGEEVARKLTKGSNLKVFYAFLSFKEKLKLKRQEYISRIIYSKEFDEEVKKDPSQNDDI